MEHQTPDIGEDAVSQLPALHLLQNLGWQYLTSDEALALQKLLTGEVRVNLNYTVITC